MEIDSPARVLQAVADYPLHGGNLEWAAERYGLELGCFLDFSANVNPLGPPPGAIDAAREALRDISRYPEPDSRSLKTAISDFLNVESETIMPGNGSTELIHHLCRCRTPKKVTVVVPGFAEYERAANICGAEIFYHRLPPQDGFSLHPEGLAQAAAASDLTFVCNPASPSGRLYYREELLPALSACRAGSGLLVVDESFMGFCPPDEARQASLLPEIAAGGLVIITTLTKLFALAGLRGPGCLVSDAESISQWEQAAYPWRVNVVAAMAGTAAMADRGYLLRTRELVQQWRKGLCEGLQMTGNFQVFPSRVNFLLLEILDARQKAGSLCDALGKKGILIRNCANFTGLDANFVRVCVRHPENNARLIEAMKEVWK